MILLERFEEQLKLCTYHGIKLWRYLTLIPNCKNTGDSNYSSKHEQVFEFVSILKTDVKVLHTHLLNY